MDVVHLRKALKLTWLNYYRTNRHWLVRLGIWVNYEEARRPSASFILGMLSVAEPQLMQLLPLVVDLNANPDRIVTALGLNFNPEDELEALERSVQAEPRPRVISPPPKMLLSTRQSPFEPELVEVIQSDEPEKLGEQPSSPTSSPPSRTAKPSQPAKQSAKQSVKQSAKQSAKQSTKQLTKSPAKPPAKPINPTRRTLDTAQLSSQELPDRV